MLFHLSKNYNYRYLRDDSKVFIVTKTPDRQYVHPTSMHVYSEPFLSKDNKTVRNALMGFTSYETCNDWYVRICNTQNITNDFIDELHPDDSVNNYFLIQTPKITNVSLSDIKHTADVFSMPLMVIMSEKQDMNKGNDIKKEYDVFYYPNRKKDAYKLMY